MPKIIFHNRYVFIFNVYWKNKGGKEMSHRIVIDDFKYDCDKKSIEADYNSAARVAGRMEGSSGLGSPIKWNDLATPCENREAAEDWINKHDRGNYDQIAVTYYDIDPHKLSSAKLRSIEEREKK